MIDPRWVDAPPPRGSQRNLWSKWLPILAAVQNQPGKWAETECDSRIKAAGASTWLGKAGCESMVRTVDGVSRVYARWPEASS